MLASSLHTWWLSDKWYEWHLKAFLLSKLYAEFKVNEHFTYFEESEAEYLLIEIFDAF